MLRKLVKKIRYAAVASALVFSFAYADEEDNEAKDGCQFTMQNFFLTVTPDLLLTQKNSMNVVANKAKHYCRENPEFVEENVEAYGILGSYVALSVPKPEKSGHVLKRYDEFRGHGGNCGKTINKKQFPEGAVEKVCKILKNEEQYRKLVQYSRDLSSSE